MNTVSIASSAMLVELSIGTWTARKLDKSVTEEVNMSKKASSQASRVNKNLLPGVEQLDAITKYAGMVRNWMYSQTLPWSDFGARLITTEAFFDFKRALDDHEKEFNRLVDTFIAKYPSLISMQAFKLGDMFNRREYPTAEEIASKFKFRVSYMPVPDSGDFRVDIGNEAVAELQAHYQRDFGEKLDQAMADVRKRLLEELHHMSERMTDKEDGKPKLFRHNVVDSLSTSLARIRQLNITKDEAIEAMVSQAEKAVAGLDGQSLKESDTLRRNVREKIDGILGAFDF